MRSAVPGALRATFLAQLEPDVRPAYEGDAGLQARLDAVPGAIAQAHGLPVDAALVASCLATAAAEAGSPAALEELDLPDLYLAAACGRGDAVALRRFDAALGPELDRAIARSPTLGLSREEFRQLVGDRLFVAEPDASPRILGYRGRGSLKAWVRVMAARFVIDLSRRRAPPGGEDDALAEKLGAAHDTELDYLRHAYGPAVPRAFEDAVARLTVRQRNLLRQRYLHGVSADGLARMYDVHRSTLFVWLDKARAALLAHVREALARQIPGHALESVVGMLGSRLELSVRRMLDSQLESE